MYDKAIKSLSLAVGLAIAGSAYAGSIDFTGSNIYMKFLDGDQGLNDTNSTYGNTLGDNGSDQGQAYELEIRMKSQISDQVEAGARIKSRFLRNYWTTESFGDEQNATALQTNKYMKLRGAYVNLTPGYDWLTFSRIGSSDWGMFDPFTFGKIRYTDRDNFNGFYFRGPMAEGTWEVARVSLMNFLGPKYQTSETASRLEGNDAAWIAQLKHPIDDFDFTFIGEYVNDTENDTNDTNIYNGQNQVNRYNNAVAGLKLNGTIADSVDLRVAAYQSSYNVNTRLTGDIPEWSMLLGDDYDDEAYLINLEVPEAGVENLGIAFQYFDIGAGYVTTTGARRESDVLITDGSEAAWYGVQAKPWGEVWTRFTGGLANDMQQVPVNHVDNDHIDFDEAGAESVVGWKGFTVIANYEAADTPMSLEYTNVDYNTNWQNWGGDEDVFNVCQYCMENNPNKATYKANQDRATDIIVLKLNHVFDVMDGLDTQFKFKYVDDEDKASNTTSADDRTTTDTGIVIAAGNQLTDDLYGSISYGNYTRDVSVGSNDYDNDKDIFSVRFDYNLSGFQFGYLAQWIDGKGDLNEDGTKEDLAQYRMKAFAKVLF
jgi:hypothetical protein